MKWNIFEEFTVWLTNVDICRRRGIRKLKIIFIVSLSASWPLRTFQDSPIHNEEIKYLKPLMKKINAFHWHTYVNAVDIKYIILHYGNFKASFRNICIHTMHSTYNTNGWHWQGISGGDTLEILYRNERRSIWSPSIVWFKKKQDGKNPPVEGLIEKVPSAKYMKGVNTQSYHPWLLHCMAICKASLPACGIEQKHNE